MAKRAFDIVVSLAGLIMFSPVLALASILIKLEDRGPVTFRQVRVGRNGEPFEILKLRTMREDVDGVLVTGADDARITRVGGHLRAWKLDELPQLVNVLRGEMSLVGPRPEVERYVEMYPLDFREILSVSPGITGLAAVEFRHESELLARTGDPEHVYITQILPAKLELGRRYVTERSFLLDVRIIIATVRAVAGSNVDEDLIRPTCE